MFMRAMLTNRSRYVVLGMGAALCCAAVWVSSLFAANPEPNVWQPDIDTARRVASQTNRLVLMHFWGPQCEPCRQVEAQVFSQPEVMKALSANYVLVKIDTNALRLTAEQYGVVRIPTDVITTPTGQVVTKALSPLTAKGYVDQLTLVAMNARPGAIGQIAKGAAPTLNNAVNTAANNAAPGGISLPAWATNSGVTPNPGAITPPPAYVSDKGFQSPATTAAAGNVPTAPWAGDRVPDYVAQRTQMVNDAAQQRFSEGQQKLNPLQQYAPGYVQQGIDRGQTSLDNSKQAVTNGSQQAVANGQQFLNNTSTNATNAVSSAIPAWATGNTASAPPTADAQTVVNQFALPPTPPPTAAPSASTPFTAQSASPSTPWQTPIPQNVATEPGTMINPWAAATNPGFQSAPTAPATSSTANTQPPTGRPAGAYLSPPTSIAPAYTPPQPNSGPPPAAMLRPATSSTTNPSSANPVATNTAAATNPKPELSTGNPPLGIEGYDVVRLIEQRKWTYGDRRWGAIHLGRTYLFSGVEEQQKFLANPNAYAPALSGNDVVAQFDEGKTVAGQRKYGIFFHNRAYLFSSQETLDKFTLNMNADRYSAEVRQAELQAAGTIRR